MRLVPAKHITKTLSVPIKGKRASLFIILCNTVQALFIKPGSLIDVMMAVVICAEVICPVFLTVYLIADSIVEVFACKLVSVHWKSRTPSLGAVAVRNVIKHGDIIIGFPVVGGIANKNILVITVVLEQSHNSVSHIGVLIHHSF